MKCAFKNCKRKPCGAKQFNGIVVRVYLCRKHLIKVANLDSHEDGCVFLEAIK